MPYDVWTYIELIGFILAACSSDEPFIQQRLAARLLRPTQVKSAAVVKAASVLRGIVHAHRDKARHPGFSSYTVLYYCIEVYLELLRTLLQKVVVIQQPS